MLRRSRIVLPSSRRLGVSFLERVPINVAVNRIELFVILVVLFLLVHDTYDSCNLAS
jgi:hypothetical protein